MGDDQIELQTDNSSIISQFGGNQWYFLVDTCAALAEKTGKTDCYTQEETELVLNDFVVDTKTAT